MNRSKKIKIYLSALFCACFLIFPLAAGAVEKPTIIIWPKTHVSGEERFHVEGTAPSQAEVIIFLEKDGKLLKEWQALANDQGEWLFSMVDLLRPGVYYLFSQARDKTGAVSDFSAKQKVEVRFSGLVLGAFLLTFKNLALGLAAALLILVILAIYFTKNNLRDKKILKKETKEAEESLHKGFDELEKDIKREIEKLESVKSKKELGEKEKEIIKNLKEDLKEVEKYIGKEIKDIEKELK